MSSWDSGSALLPTPTGWLASEVAVVERSSAVVTAELGARCRADRIELPTPGRVERIVRSALAQAERQLTAEVAGSLSGEVRDRLEKLIADHHPVENGEDHLEVLALVKSSPGNVSLDSMLTEITKLGLVRGIGVPTKAFTEVAAKVVAGWRAKAAVEAPSHLRRHPDDLRITLLAALIYERELEITDSLVELLIATVHRINARADRRVTSELTNAFQ